VLVIVVTEQAVEAFPPKASLILSIMPLDVASDPEVAVDDEQNAKDKNAAIKRINRIFLFQLLAKVVQFQFQIGISKRGMKFGPIKADIGIVFNL
jgi:hypothetical protein